MFKDKAHVATLRKFLREDMGFCKLVPAGQEVNNGNGARAMVAMINSSKDHADFMTKLAAALV